MQIRAIGVYSGSITDYTKAIELIDEYPNKNSPIPIIGGFGNKYVYYNRAVIKYYSGDKNGACKDARKAEDLGMDTSSFIEAACS